MNHDNEWQPDEAQLRAALAGVAAAPARAAPTGPRYGAFAEAVREMFRRERRERERLERRVDDLERELAVSRRLDEIAQRLDKIEAAPRGSAGLRAV